MGPRFGWVLFAFFSPLLVMFWGLLTLTNARLGWLLLLFGLVVLGTSTVLEVKGQEHLAGKVSVGGQGRQSVLAGLFDGVATFAGSVGAMLILVLVVVFLRSLGHH